MVVIWQAIQMAYSIAAATIAALKRFTESLNTGFGHGELIRVHGRSQDYKLSDRSASSKDSRTCKPSTGGQSPSNRRKPQTPQTTPQEEFDVQQLSFGSKNLNHEAMVSSSQKSSGSGKKAPKANRLNDNIIMHDVQYSIHYDEEPLVPRITSRT